MNSITNASLLTGGVFCNGIYGLGLKPVNTRCRSLAELELFNCCFSGVAFLGAAVAAWINGPVTLDLIGLATAALFGLVFSICVFSNLKALSEGPLSLTMLMINFSLVIPLVYSFCFLGEAFTIQRIFGLILLAVCMFLFTNPKITGEKKLSARWLFWTLTALATNGALAIISKMYALQTNNVYAWPFLACCYLFATLTSCLLFLTVKHKQRSDRHTTSFFSPMMLFLIVLIGMANFGLNLAVLLLATAMDGAIVYPVIQGGGPLVAIVGSRLIFGEQISWKKAISILLGILAIVLLNL